MGGQVGGWVFEVLSSTGCVLSYVNTFNEPNVIHMNESFICHPTCGRVPFHIWMMIPHIITHSQGIAKVEGNTLGVLTYRVAKTRRIP